MTPSLEREAIRLGIIEDGNLKLRELKRNQLLEPIQLPVREGWIAACLRRLGRKK